MNEIIPYKKIEEVEGFRPQNGMNYRTNNKNYSIVLMSESIENIVLLEANLSNLKSLINKLRDENLEFSKDLRLKDESLLKQKNQLKEWKNKYHSLKIANTFLGSDDKSLTCFDPWVKTHKS